MFGFADDLKLVKALLQQGQLIFEVLNFIAGHVVPIY
jgi:hypothetical protein